MATDRLHIPFQCPACERTIKLPTRSGYEGGRTVVRIDTAPVDDHIATHHKDD